MRVLASILALLFLQLALLPGEMCASSGNVESPACEPNCTKVCAEMPQDAEAPPEDNCLCNPLQACGQCALPMPSPSLIWEAVPEVLTSQTTPHIPAAPMDIVLEFWQPPKLV